MKFRDTKGREIARFEWKENSKLLKEVKLLDTNRTLRDDYTDGYKRSTLGGGFLI